MEKILPEAFFSHQPPQRIIGTECEYNVQAGTKPEGRYALTDYIKPEVVTKAGMEIVPRGFLSNGGRLYYDVGHLEYDAAESLGPRLAAASDLAGKIVMQEVIEESGLACDGVYRISGSYLPHKQEESNGYHENYLIPRSAAEAPSFALFMPSFLASRLWALNGTIRGANFVLSQKVWGINGSPISSEMGRRTGKNKPMIMVPLSTSDSDVFGTKREWGRIEVRYADPGLSPTASFASLGATSAVLRLAEHPEIITPKQVQDWALDNPVMSARRFAADCSMKANCETLSGKRASAANIQEELFRLVLKLAEHVELPEEEVLAVKLGQRFAERLGQSNFETGEYNGLENFLDTVAKHKFLLNRHETNAALNDSNPQALADNLAWDRIVPNGVAERWWESHPSNIVEPALVELLVKEPPKGTRAYRRGKAIAALGSSVSYASWAKVSTASDTTPLEDPYDMAA